MHQNGYGSHPLPRILGDKQFRDEIIVERIVQLVRQLVDIRLRNTGKLRLYDLLSVGHSGGIGHGPCVRYFSNPQHFMPPDSMVCPPHRRWQR